MNDDWDFLAQRSAGNIHDLFRPHYEHWVTLPALAYRLLWWMVGARTYLPYQLLVIVAHLSVAALLRVVMRRAGVGPWVATVSAAAFALFGAGYDNMILAFQITFVGSLAFGLVHLLLADHDGPIDRRDWIGATAGLAGVMCSLVGVTMVVVVGLATLFRRGWRAALFHTVPIGAIFVVWWVSAGGRTYAGSHHINQLIDFVRIGLTATFEALGQVWGIGVALAIVLVVGLGVAWAGLRRDELRRQASVPAALLLGAVVFLAITGYGRSGRGLGAAIAFSPERARESRYLHVVAAMLLPAIAVAASHIIRRWRLLGPLLLAVLLIGIPGNVHILAVQERIGRSQYLTYKRALLAVPRLPRVNELPRDLQPEFGVTVGWLVNAARAGKLPLPEPPFTLAVQRAELLVLALEPEAWHPPAAACQLIRRPVALLMQNNDRLEIRGKAHLVYVAHDGTTSAPVDFGAVLLTPYVPPYLALNVQPVRAIIGPLPLRITPLNPQHGAVLCTTAKRANPVAPASNR